MSERPDGTDSGGRGTTYHHGDLAEAAVEAAIADIETHGDAEALSLRRIAAAVGVSHRALYRHYADREDLLAAVAARGYRLLAAEVCSTAGTSEAFCRAYVRFALARPALYNAMMRASGGAKPKALEEAVATMIAAARRAIGSDRAVKRAWIILHGGVSLHLSGALAPRSGEELADFLIDLLGVGAGRAS